MREAARLRGLADYAPRQGNLSLSIDNFGNDGNIPANEKDNIQSDIENVRRGQGNDVISGSSANNKLEGQGGHDTIYGGAGNDTLLGNSGNDWLFGQDGADSIDGSANDDRVIGGADVDVLLGGAGSKHLHPVTKVTPQKTDRGFHHQL